jgi:hypothetical protein
MERIAVLVSDLERLGDADAREKARELVTAVLALHKDGLDRMLEIARARGDAGLSLAFAKDPLVASLLELHELLPDATLLPAASLVRKAPHASCELCGATIPERHEHLVDAERQGLSCACAPCAVLFPARRIRPRAERLRGFELTDTAWEALGIPIGLAFFVRSSKKERTLALYPSPAGPTESLLPVDLALPELAPDVEALLVNRVRGKKDYFVVSIDRAYELVGVLRSTWRGFTGGEAAWSTIEGFFRDLEGPC